MRKATMTPEELRQMKLKSGYREPQRIITHYKPTKPASTVTEDKEHIGLEHHAERRAQNRAIRDKAQNTPKEKIKRAVKKGAEKVKAGVDYAAPRIKAGAMRVAANANRSAGGRDSGMINIRPPADMFSFQAPSFMMGPPGLGLGMQQEPAPRPRRRKPKKRRAPARHQEQGQNWRELGGVPDSVKRWMM